MVTHSSQTYLQVHLYKVLKIAAMSNGLTPSSNGPNDCNKELNKEGGSLGLSLRAPLYVEVHELMIDDGSCNFMCKDFVSKYDLCCVGMRPKQIQLLGDCTKKEVQKYFGLVVNKNGHHYSKCSNVAFIVKAKKLWINVHQKPYVLASKLITLSMARGMVSELKGKMNWPAYGEWFSAKQFRYMKAKGAIDVGVNYAF
jgi:hypothetical protein